MAETDYKSTLKLPKTDFPMKANLPKREPETLKHWDDLDLYARLMEARKDARSWVLHDGPPYANGRVHLGTALNKILKDFVVRSRSMLGISHAVRAGMGLPRHADRVQGLARRSAATRRARCPSSSCASCAAPKRRSGSICSARIFGASDVSATGSIRISRWRRSTTRRKSACCARWSRTATSIAACARCIGASTAASALAEAEVEYEDHVSPSIYVAFAFNSNLKDAGALAAGANDRAELAAAHKSGKLAAVIWTTTPWTLPANLGISLNETFDYVALKVGEQLLRGRGATGRQRREGNRARSRETNRARPRGDQGARRPGYFPASVFRRAT